MLRSPSFLARATRALTALVTVWCLGCSGFDPLVDALLGAGGASAMVCDSNGTMGAASTDAAAPTDRTVSSAPEHQRAFECGCGSSCNGASPVHSVADAFKSVVPLQLTANPLVPASISRTPLLPPPEPAV